MRVELRDDARDDLVEAAWFYRRQSVGLDEYFLQCLGEDLRKLQTTFGVHERRHGFHRKLSDRFPFAIYYQLEDGFVDFVAILDCRSHPDSTDARLGRIKP